MNCMKYYKFTQYVWLKMRDFEVKNANIFWGGLSPPQTPPKNVEGDTPSSNSSPQCREGSNFLSFIPPTRESWIRRCWNALPNHLRPFHLFPLLDELWNITYSCLLILTVVQNLVRSNQLNVSESWRSRVSNRWPSDPRAETFTTVPHNQLPAHLKAFYLSAYD